MTVSDSKYLFSAIEQTLKAEQSLLEKIKQNTNLMHPHFDGNSLGRILDVTEKTIQSPPLELKTKPRNWLRKFKVRKKLGYWNF